jgi:hypothetical protein
MQEFWSIVSKWEPIGQGLFFLIVLAAAFVLLQQTAFYATVWLRGWPPCGSPVNFKWPCE